MRFTELTEDSYDRGVDKRKRLAKLYNDRASLREQLKNAREEQDSDRVANLESKLGKLEDSIEALAESASPATALKAKIAQLKADLADMPDQPGSQEGYDAVDDLRDQLKKAEEKLKGLTEASPSASRNASNDATIAFEQARDRAVSLLDALRAQIDQFSRAQQKNARDWGYAGSMGHVVAQLEDLHNFFGN